MLLCGCVVWCVGVCGVVCVCRVNYRKVLSLSIIKQVNQKLLYRESDWWDVGLVGQKARKQGTIC